MLVFIVHVSPSTDAPIVHALLAFVTTPETHKKESHPSPTSGEREQRHTSKDSSRLSTSLVGTTGLQEDMAGPSQSDLECMKSLLPELYAETLVSAHFLCAESDL